MGQPTHSITQRVGKTQFWQFMPPMAASETAYADAQFKLTLASRLAPLFCLSLPLLPGHHLWAKPWLSLVTPRTRTLRLSLWHQRPLPNLNRNRRAGVALVYFETAVSSDTGLRFIVPADEIALGKSAVSPVSVPLNEPLTEVTGVDVTVDEEASGISDIQESREPESNQDDAESTPEKPLSATVSVALTTIGYRRRVNPIRGLFWGQVRGLRVERCLVFVMRAYNAGMPAKLPALAHGEVAPRVLPRAVTSHVSAPAPVFAVWF